MFTKIKSFIKSHPFVFIALAFVVGAGSIANAKSRGGEITDSLKAKAGVNS